MSQQVQAQFIRSAKKPGLEMVKVIIPGRKQEGEWVDCPENVKKFAGSSFHEGDAIIMTADFANNKYNVSRIEKAGGTPPPAQATQAPQQSINLNNKFPVQQTYVSPAPVVAQPSVIAPPKQYMNPKTPQESAQIMRLSVYASACQAVKALTGQINPNTISDVIDVIYKRGLTNVKK